MHKPQKGRTTPAQFRQQSFAKRKIERIDRLIDNLQLLIQGTKGNKKFIYQYKLRQADELKRRVKRSLKRKLAKDTKTIFVTGGPPSIVQGGLPGSKR